MTDTHKDIQQYSHSQMCTYEMWERYQDRHKQRQRKWQRGRQKSMQRNSQQQVVPSSSSASSHSQAWPLDADVGPKIHEHSLSFFFFLRKRGKKRGWSLFCKCFPHSGNVLANAWVCVYIYLFIYFLLHRCPQALSLSRSHGKRPENTASPAVAVTREERGDRLRGEAGCACGIKAGTEMAVAK